MANTDTSDSIEFAVMQILGRGAFSSEVRNLILSGSFNSYLDADKARAKFDYVNAREFGIDYLLCKFLSKWKGWTVGDEDLSTRALASWTASEAHCKETNKRIRDVYLQGKDPCASILISRIQRKIEGVLGRLDLFSVMGRNRWSTGATLATKRGTTVQQKMSVPIAVSPRALKYIRKDIEHDPLWSMSILGVRPSGPYSLLPCVFDVVDENRWLTVPKDAKTDRAIGAEPAGNTFLQQGVGRYIRSRLMHFGVNLDDQSINQRGALLAYNDGLATLDLKSASDSVSRELVWLLLPLPWAELLDDLRCSYSRFPDGSRVRLEKFSSMGNAFTFELESLIFWALCSSVTEMEKTDGPVWVYGDDLIVPRKSSSSIIHWLECFGFQVNTEKSFTQGPFYESCGKHYFVCDDVTPIYQKDLVRDNPSIIRFANRLERWRLKHERQFGHDDFCNLILEAQTLILMGYKGRFPKIPISDSDDGFIASRSELADCPFDPNNGYHCWVLRFKAVALDEDVIAVNKFGQARIVSLDYLALKLRDPFTSFSDSQGRLIRTERGFWYYGHARVHRRLHDDGTDV